MLSVVKCVPVVVPVKLVVGGNPLPRESEFCTRAVQGLKRAVRHLGNDGGIVVVQRLLYLVGVLLRTCG